MSQCEVYEVVRSVSEVVRSVRFDCSEVVRSVRSLCYLVISFCSFCEYRPSVRSEIYFLDLYIAICSLIGMNLDM